MQLKQSHLRNRRSAIVTLSIAMVATGAFAVARGQESDPPYSSSGRVAQSVQKEQSASFAVFERARTEADEMTREARRQVGNSTNSGRNMDLSRAIRTPTGRGWAIPGDGTICIVVPDPVDGFGIGCVPTEQAAGQGAFVIMGPPDGALELTLLAPRGSKVTARARDGSEHPLRADADGVVSELLSGVHEIDVATRSGVHTIPMPVPIGAPPRPPTQG